jgi:hypothetical protein
MLVVICMDCGTELLCDEDPPVTIVVLCDHCADTREDEIEITSLALEQVS